MLTLSKLKNEQLSLKITDVKVVQENLVKITFLLSSSDISQGFFWRELGIIAKDPDTSEEILYCYGNARENGEYLAPSGEADILEKYVNVYISVNNTEIVKVTIDDSLIYVTNKELDKKLEEAKQEINDLDTKMQDELNKKANKKKVWSITLDTEWIEEEPCFTKVVAVEGIQETDIPNINLIYSDDYETRQLEKEEYSKLSMVKSSENSIKLICDEDKPETTLNIRIEVTY